MPSELVLEEDELAKLFDELDLLFEERLLDAGDELLPVLLANDDVSELLDLMFELLLVELKLPVLLLDENDELLILLLDWEDSELLNLLVDNEDDRLDESALRETFDVDELAGTTALLFT